ncbi:MAG: GNAT family N-acetyltransferase [Pikeienuella sp.]
MAPLVWARHVGAAQALAYGAERMAARAADGDWIVADPGQGAVAGLMSHALPPEPLPIPNDIDPLFLPLQMLENLVPGSWYVHVLATDPAHRGQGWGGRLLALADARAQASGVRRLSIIVADDNHAARRLYARHGFCQIDHRCACTEGWETETRSWLLLAKPLDPQGTPVAKA